jgi:hypothetical protein
MNLKTKLGLFYFNKNCFYVFNLGIKVILFQFLDYTREELKLTNIIILVRLIYEVAS